MSDNIRVESKNGKLVFQISEIFIENLKRQRTGLQTTGKISKDDYVMVDTYFGYFNGNSWIDVPLVALCKVSDAFVMRMTDELRIDIKPIRIEI